MTKLLIFALNLMMAILQILEMIHHYVHPDRCVFGDYGYLLVHAPLAATNLGVAIMLGRDLS